MFAKTFSFWRRLVQPPPAASAEPTGPLVHDERRLWVRYRADLSAQVELPKQQGNRRVHVRVRDMSLGGASFDSSLRFQSGQMITLELPTRDDESRTVLACVVRCSNGGAANTYNIGCVFSRELSDDDLQLFGAQRVEASGADQRRWQRFDCNWTAFYQVVGEPHKAPCAAQVLNISASGIGLQVSEPLEAGSLVNLDLYDRDGNPVRSILACIVHTTTRANGERAIGCNFIRELAEDELQSLI